MLCFLQLTIEMNVYSIFGKKLLFVTYGKPLVEEK